MRNIQDAELNNSVALPAAGASASAASHNLGGANDPIVEAIDFEISVPATPDLVDAETLTFTVEDSADDSSFAAIEELATFVVTGDGGNGADATSRKVKLPGSTKQYVRVSAAVSASAGDNTGVSFTSKILV